MPNTDKIYVFGGFYSNEKNYLAFQTDISIINVREEVTISNVPKNFHFDYVLNKYNGTKTLNKIKNDFVRPRIEYEIL